MLEDIIQLDKKYYMNTFGSRLPVCFEKGEGMKLFDDKGNTYYDFLGGIAVNALGHGHKDFIAALKNQLDKVIHTSSLYYIENQAKLAQKIVQLSCAQRVFFCNSGAEANEGAIAAQNAIVSIPTVILFENGKPVKKIVGAHAIDDYEDAIDEIL